MTDWLAGVLPRSLAARVVVLLLILGAAFVWSARWAGTQLTAVAQGRQAILSELLLSQHFAPHDLHRSAAEPPDAVRPGPTAARLRWAALIGPSGELVELRRDPHVSRERVAALLNRDPAELAQPLLLPDEPDARCVLLSVADADGGRRVAVFELGGREWPTSPAPVGPLAVAITGLVLALVWLRVAILDPVKRTADRVAAAQRGLLSLAAGDAPDELAGVAAVADATRRELDRWRAEATYLRNAMEQEIAGKTKAVEYALRRAEQRADTDALTGLLNRYALERELPALVARHQQGGRELALLLLDVNHFKRFNDTLGHVQGDALLNMLGHLLRGCTRRGVDLAARYGGDEFVVVLPDTPLAEAAEVGQRLATLFAQQARRFGERAPAVGLAVGVAGLLAGRTMTAGELLERADRAMYAAKRGGRTAAPQTAGSSAGTTGRAR